jgi:hypothetical protein
MYESKEGLKVLVLGAVISCDIIRLLGRRRLMVQEYVALDLGVAIVILLYVQILIVGYDIISGMQFNRF